MKTEKQIKKRIDNFKEITNQLQTKKKKPNVNERNNFFIDHKIRNIKIAIDSLEWVLN